MNIVCFVFKQKTAYEMRISDWSSDVCSSDLRQPPDQRQDAAQRGHVGRAHAIAGKLEMCKRNLLLGRKEDLCPDDAIRDPRDDRRNLPQFPDRKSVGSGKSVSVRVDLGGRGNIKKKKKNK